MPPRLDPPGSLLFPIPMSRRPVLALALAPVAMVALTASPALAGGASATDRAVRTSLHLDTAGTHAGTLLVRTVARYRKADAQPGERWLGQATLTVIGPGGRTVVRDTRPLPHVALGGLVEHRMVIGRTETRRILGSTMQRATVRVRGTGRIVRAGAGASQVRRVENGAGNNSPALPIQSIGGGAAITVNAGVLIGGGYSPTAQARHSFRGPPLRVNAAMSWPPPPQTWGGQLTVSFLGGWPYTAFVSSMVVPVTPQPGYPSQVQLEPTYSATGVPTSGVVGPDGTFMLTGSQVAGNTCPQVGFTVAGQLPPRLSRTGTGPFGPGTAQVAYTWSGVSPGSCSDSDAQPGFPLPYGE